MKMKTRFILIPTLVALTAISCSTFKSSNSNQDHQTKNSSLFEPIQIHDLQYKVENKQGNQCLLVWSFRLKNKRNVDLVVQPILTLKKGSQSKNSLLKTFLGSSLLESNQIEFFSGMTDIDNCRKGQVSFVHISDIITQRQQ